MYWLTQHQNAISALSLKRQLGVSCQVAWLLTRKLMQTMQQRDGPNRRTEDLDIDDAYVGANAGRINDRCRAENITAFVAAVLTPVNGRPMFMCLTPVADSTNQILENWARRYVAPGCIVVSAGALALGRDSTDSTTNRQKV